MPRNKSITSFEYVPSFIVNQSQPFDDDDWDEDDEELMENEDELDEEDDDVENMKLVDNQGDLLIPPTINWQELSPLGSSQQRERQPVTNSGANYVDDDILPIPKMKW